MTYSPYNQGTYNSTPPTLTSGQVSAVQLDAHGNQLVVLAAPPTVTVGNASLPVTGTVAVTGAYQATQPVSVASAVTVAQTTASSLNATVVGTVTANAGTGTFTTSDAHAYTSGSATSGQAGFLELGAVTTAMPAYTTGQSAPLSLTLVGGLRSDNTSWGGTTLGGAANFGVTPGAVASSSTNASLFIGTVSAAASASGVQKVGISGAAGATCDGVVTAATSPANGLMHLGIYNSTLPTLTTGQSAGTQVDAKGQLLVDVNYVGGVALTQGAKTSSASIPVVIASDQAAVLTKLSPQTSGGCLVYSGSIGATATAIKTTAGQIYGLVIGNSNTAPVYVQLFNSLTTGVTLGTTAPVMSIYVPVGGGVVRDFSNGVAFSTAISYACTTTRTGSTSPTNTVDCNVDYL